MKIEFAEDYLRELYEEGRSINKKYRFQLPVIRQYKNTVDKLKAARRIEDLFVFKSLNYEKLTGDKKGFESVRVNQQFRILFISRIEGNVPDVFTICLLTELSKHYQ